MFHFHKTTKPDPKEKWKLVHNKKINRPFVRIKEENKYNGGYYLTHSQRGHEKLPDLTGKDKRPSYFVKKFYRNPKKDFFRQVRNLSEKNKAAIEKYHKRKYVGKKPIEVQVTKSPEYLRHSNKKIAKKKH